MKSKIVAFSCLLAVASSLAGCAADAEDTTEDAVVTDDTTTALTAAQAEVFAGTWRATYWELFIDLLVVDFKKDGTYSALVPAGSGETCTNYSLRSLNGPYVGLCFAQESGRWDVAPRGDGTYNLTLTPSVRAGKAVSQPIRTYVASRSGATLTLTRGAKTSKLSKQQ